MAGRSCGLCVPVARGLGTPVCVGELSHDGWAGWEQGLGDTLVTAGRQLWGVQGKKGEEAQPCQSRASD